MPRPRTYKEEARTQTITVRVTAGHHARLAAEAAQAGKSLAGLAEHYLTRGSVQVNAANTQLDPATFAELKRIATDLHLFAQSPAETLSPKVGAIAGKMHELFQLLLKDELLSQRINDLRTRTSNDSTAPSARHEFQRIV